jgi:hypothetical protein
MSTSTTSDLFVKTYAACELSNPVMVRTSAWSSRPSGKGWAREDPPLHFLVRPTEHTAPPASGSAGGGYDVDVACVDERDAVPELDLQVLRRAGDVGAR